MHDATSKLRNEENPRGIMNRKTKLKTQRNLRKFKEKTYILHLSPTKPLLNKLSGLGRSQFHYMTITCTYSEAAYWFYFTWLRHIKAPLNKLSNETQRERSQRDREEIKRSPPSAGFLSKCPQQVGFGQAEAKSLKFKPGLPCGQPWSKHGASSAASQGAQEQRAGS